MPAYYSMLQKTEFDWQYHLEKSEKASLGIKDGCYFPRGKILGGTGAMDMAMYVRGNRADYDSWEELGNKGWNFRDLLKYFKKSENNSLANEDDEWRGMHGDKGPMKVDYFFSYDPIKEMLVAAAEEINLKVTPDVNGESQIGFSIVQGIVSEGKRQSSVKSFLMKTSNRPNLHIIKNAHVTKVLLNNRGLVEGVQFILNGKKKKVNANLEVILSAGAIGTPKILLNSGIGPKEHLKKIGVSVNHDLAGVGRNLQDHVAVLVPIKLHKKWARLITDSDWVDDAYQYFIHTVGFPSHIGVSDLTAFLNTTSPTSETPDIQFMFSQFRRGEQMRLKKILDNYGFDDSINESFMSAIDKNELLLVKVLLLQPKSKGQVELRSRDPLEKPIIHGNYLHEKEDVETLIRGVSMVKRLINTNTSREHLCYFAHVNISGCSEIEFDAPGYWECYIRHMTTTMYNPTSTAKMGPETDKNAVVDEKLNVKGLKALRVVDASIMPNVIRGNTYAATVMIAEKASDMIKRDWKMPKIKTEL
jgi:choline dehydrogenase